MSTEIIVPPLGESVTTATIARWMKQAGERVAADEPLVELETDKVTVEVNAPQAGVLADILAREGAEVEVGAVLGTIGEGGGTTKAPPPAKPSQKAPEQASRQAGSKLGIPDIATPEAKPAANPSPGVNQPPPPSGPVSRSAQSAAPQSAAFPAAQKMMTEQHLSGEVIGQGSGKDGRITKGDVLEFLEKPAAKPAAVKVPHQDQPRAAAPGEERVKMTRLRRTIAARLKEAQNNAAMLTTFNEVDMSAVMALRHEYKDTFEKKHKGARLGFMSLFVKACIAGLKEFPAVNAEIDGDDIVYKNFVHMGIAVGGANGLVVPVVRDADQLSLAAIEAKIADFGKRAREGSLKLEELSGGTFSITNGGVYGSLMSTPILNPPQSAILGMHKIQDRPIAIGGKAEIRPMMYLAVSYDHRIIDGREAVSFLVRVKESIEDPRRILLEI
jgi:2-oxoglutarate dehydrogenase E2 component (dihydrolipoamide succinyltransferase)